LRISGWARIGVVLSGLWVVGWPIYLTIDHNHHVSDRVIKCMRYESQDECRRIHGPYMTPEYIARMMVGAEPETGAFWLLTLD
jgi:hypothetical protein